MKQLTLFQRKVYTVVKKIPEGETRSYAWVAREAGRPGAVRAVGTALKKIRIQLLCPATGLYVQTGPWEITPLGRI